LYHQDYIKILFNLNIAEDKRKDFLQEYISPEIIEVAPNILDADINKVFGLLNSLESNSPDFSRLAGISKENLYKNISNPDDKFKNKQNVYRA
jgi:hypothetical protein